jgi:quercetin dioxygenase-like cupin family protein
MIKSTAISLWLVPTIIVALTAVALGEDSAPAPTGQSATPTYTYATNGVVDHVVDRIGDKWKLLLNESNLGGKELELAEVTFPAGTVVGAHRHGSVEIIYVLSGVYGHEVNGKLYLLKPGMVGIVRPEDHVRHLVPKSGDAKVLIIWAPPGEAVKFFPKGKGDAPEPIPEAKALGP